MDTTGEPSGQLPAERGTLCHCRSLQRLSEAIFSFPDNLSRNIKDSVTTVKLTAYFTVGCLSIWLHPEIHSAPSLFVLIGLKYRAT